MGTFKILTTTDEAVWQQYLDLVPEKELVHYPAYTRVYEKYGDGIGECFVYEEDGIVLYPYLRRKIEGSDKFTDIITPYGYGGPVYMHYVGQAPGFFHRFRHALVDYLRATDTVSEFVRFHPLLANHKYFCTLMDEVKLQCKNAVIDLSVGPTAIFSEYRSSYQQCIRKAISANLHVEIVDPLDCIDPFFELYSASMSRKFQKGYLLFRREFLVHLAKELGSQLKCFVVKQDNQILAMALFLRSRNYLDYFLAASRMDTLYLHPNHILLHHVALWAIENKIEKFHLGGGHPSLQFFKHGFSNSHCFYYVGKHILDSPTYTALSIKHWSNHGKEWTPDHPYFPGYRASFESA